MSTSKTVAIQPQYPLTENQKVLWIAHEMKHKTGLYHEPVSIQIKGNLDVQRLQKALQHIVNKHAALQMCVINTPEGPKQIIQEDVQITMACYDWCAYQAEEKSLMLDHALQEVLHEPFDFTSGALLRFQLFQLEQNNYLLHIVFHHIMFDGWSMGLFLQDLEQAYNSYVIEDEGRISVLDSYHDLIQKQQNYRETESYMTSEKYWRAKLEETLPWSAFPFHVSKPRIDSYKEGAYQTFIDTKLTDAIHHFAKTHRISTYRVLLSIYIVLLHQMTNQTNLVVGMPINVRERHTQEQGVFGYFVNTVPLRITFSPDDTFIELVQKVSVLVQEALEHKEYPIHHMTNALHTAEEHIHSAPYATVFNMVTLPPFHMEALETKVITHQKRVSAFDMVWRMMKIQENQLQLEIDYNAALYTEQDVQTFVKRFQHIIQKLLSSSACPLRDVDILLPQDYVLYQQNSLAHMDPIISKTLDQLIDEQARETPIHVAMTMGGQSLTYQELQVRSTQVAQALLQKGLKKQERVSILMHRSMDAIVSMIGVLKAGGTYVPIDPHFPVERIHFMLQDSKSVHIITHQKTNLSHLVLNRSIIVYEKTSTIKIMEDVTSEHTMQDAAYIIYTSGSTGHPKGVLISHQSVIQFIHSLQEIYGFQKQQVHLQFASFIFDASVWEIYGSLLTGGRLHLVAEIEKKSVDHFIAVIQKQSVQYCLVPTVFFHTLTQAPSQQLKQLLSLRYIFVGGETLLPAMVRNWQSKVGLHIPVVNAYGPTEITVCATTYPVVQLLHEEQTHIPIGKPLPHIKTYVLNEQGKLCPPYVPGEIYIGGSSLATEYINQPEKTTETFLQQKILNTPEMKVYKSGDQGRMTYDGHIDFLGRKDNQVKIRGYRIELEEIEERLLQYPSIQEAVVMVYQNENEAQKLLAFYKALENRNVNTRDLQAFLSKSLPDFMIPGTIQRVEDFPVTPSGKIDQKALLSTFETGEMHQDTIVVPPHTHTEKQLQQIWGEILQKKTEIISTEDDFFAIGGHSLLTVQLINRIETQLHVKMTFKDVYQYRTIQTCSTYIDQLRPIAYKSPIERVPEQPYYPVSNAQQRLWFLYQQHPEYRTYDIPMQVHIQSGIQVILLKQALEEMLKRHEIFRTTFIEKDGEPMQCIQKKMDFIFHEIDIQQIEEKQQEAYRLASIQKIDHTAFHLEQGPLFRTILFTENKECSWLYINFHHIIMDEWSLQRFLQEVFSIYKELSEQRVIPLIQPDIRYIDYVAWQNQQLATGAWEHEKQYWKQALQDVPTLALPLDHVRPRVTSHRGDTFSTKLNKNDVASLKKLAQQEQISLYMLLFTAYTHFLQQISGQQDFVVGTPVTGRQQEAFEDIQGFFVNTVAIRVQTGEVSTMEELCAEVTERCLLAFQHQQYPFDQVIQDSSPKRGENSNPIFSTMFSYQQDVVQQHFSYQYQIYPVQTNISKFDLSLACEELNDEILFHFEYASDLFERVTISRFIQQFVHTVQVMIHHFKTPLSKVNLLPETDRMLYQQLNDTELVLPPYQSIQERFCDQVHRRPEAIAISTEHNRYTYQEIHQRSNQVANVLLQLGIQKQERVAIFLERSVESIIVMLGILKAGGTYVPIDVKYPSERIQYILQDSQARVLITKVELEKEVTCYQGNMIIIGDVFKSAFVQDIPNQNSVEDAAYMIYTSGSTGNPKGTLLKHHGVLNLVEWRAHTFRITENDIISQFYSHSFDSSISEIFSALLTGARLYLLNEEQRFSTHAYCKAISTNRITITDVATAFFNQLATELSDTQIQQIQFLRVLSMGGEAASAESIRIWQSKLKDRVLLVNEYGPTETTVSALYYPISKQITSDSTHVPVGKPIANTNIYILNEHLQLCPIGVIGELYIESIGTAIGYHNQPERTAQSFVSHPFSTEPSARLYRTGDLVRLSQEGDVEYMGRRDRQVKLRGYRIELGEIEDSLIKEPRIQQAVVLLQEEKQELHAYFTSSDIATIDIEEVYNHTARILPAYMVPKGYVCVQEIPITPNGKIDVVQLTAQYTVQYRQNKNNLRPTTETQMLLATVWEEVLGVQQIGLQDDFFALGGHSLKIMPTLVKLKPYFPTLHIQDFFKYRTIEKLAEKIEKDQQHRTIENSTNEQNSSETQGMQQPNVIRKQSVPLQLTKQYPQCVLLTGVTGFLGAHILEQLLTLPHTRIYCLARSQHGESVEQRVMEKMKFYFDETTLEQMKHRVQVIEGDLREKHVGLTAEMKRTLLRHIDAIIHCGGDVRHYGDRDHFQKVNVESTRYLLQISKKAGARFHYISTVSIAGHRPDDSAPFVFSEQDFDRGQQVENVYVESKFLAEKLVREAIAEGVSATVYRVGNLVGRTQDGKFQQNIGGNAFYRLIKALFLLQKAPDLSTYIDLVPIDFGSKAIVGLACMEQSKGETFHICNSIQLEWNQFISHLQQTGYLINMVKGTEFMNLFTNRTLTEEQMHALEMLIPVLEETDQYVEAIITSQHTEEFLKILNITCEYPNQEWISKCISYGETMGFFPKKSLSLLTHSYR
ncbi:TPA: amino acid adenylation domain-containing protein [Bacillus cereus]|nr:amino acid adenylation domain-containing protein [Bacillus cereus]HEF1869163.1 amino acid adenylation domain-containing protein [Bacillus cereus]HEF1879699.1 amino acid adenylation domain-containing protein [Bacillus cereus]HEF1885748.1 amino acid adenylation domain-containing protein [Bacillus cereus]